MCKDINEFNKVLSILHVIKKDNGTILADTTSILCRWEKFYSNLLNVYQSTSLEGSEIYIHSQTSQNLVF